MQATGQGYQSHHFGIETYVGGRSRHVRGDYQSHHFGIETAANIPSCQGCLFAHPFVKAQSAHTMLSPLTGKPMQVVVRLSTLYIRKEPFSVMYHVWRCVDSGEEFEDEAMMETNLRQAYDQYRSKYNLPFPEEIRSIREQYGLSAAKMSEVLRFGINQYKQYEHGELPSESNASLIFLARNPAEFIQLVEFSGLPLEEKKRVVHRAETVLHDQAGMSTALVATQFLMGGLRPDVERGFSMPDLSKFAHMARFFAILMSPFKTQMNKLLFYSDFLHFKRHGRSISGSKYRAIDMGPVPNNFDSLFQYIENQGIIRMEHQEYPNGSIGTRFINLEEAPAAALSETEYSTLQAVFERFKEVRIQEIVQISHEEEAWTKNVANRALLSYLDAYLLKAMA